MGDRPPGPTSRYRRPHSANSRTPDAGISASGVGRPYRFDLATRTAALAWRATTDPGPAELAITEHLPRRPWWTCRACQLEWPCQPARNELRQRLTRRILGLFMGECMRAAINEMTAPEPGSLYERFLAWVTRPVDTGEEQ